MYTTLRATSKTLQDYLVQRFIADPHLANFVDPGLGGNMIISLATPEEMTNDTKEGLSLWLYTVIRDPDSLNAPPTRISFDEFRSPPLPVRLHYLMTPIVRESGSVGAETE